MDLQRLFQALRQGSVDPWASSLYWKDSPSPPPAPDYAGAARATNESSRTNQYTPYGSLTWTPGHEGTAGTPAQYVPKYKTDPTNGQQVIDGYDIIPATPGQAAVPWSSTVTLNPLAQKALDTQLQTSAGMGSIAEGMLPQVADQYSRPMDLSSVQDIADKSYAGLTSRLDPQWKQNEEMQKTSLANQGLVAGGEAYDNAMRVFDQSKNDAYTQAALAAIQTMPQTYQLASETYNQPLNTMNALRGGAQVVNPQFQGTGPGANLLQAAQAQGQYAQGLYGAQVGETNAQNSNTYAAAAAVIAAMI